MCESAWLMFLEHQRTLISNYCAFLIPTVPAGYRVEVLGYKFNDDAIYNQSRHSL